ncbi:MAG: DUF2817 domain-containing protein [Candidatus Riflebacteria bacterium]|nr:DUF2817 domain-containing protein [Candidatus Riflebacteria bacterium]
MENKIEKALMNRRVSFLAMILFFVPGILSAIVLTDYRSTKEPVSYNDFLNLVEKIKNSEKLEWTVEYIGESSGGRPIVAIKYSSPFHVDNHTIAFIGLQHGDEPAGKDALIYLINNLYSGSEKIPSDTSILFIPAINPDGFEGKKRENDAGADLNRDHQILSQPETQALHYEITNFQPDIVVDCHEFSKDPKGYAEKGWYKHPDIMLDTANNPYFSDLLYAEGGRWIKVMENAFALSPHKFSQYFVGGPPPEKEIRPSTLEMDDARNSLAAEGRLSFLIESGRFLNSDDPYSDLPARIDAYILILREFLYNTKEIVRSREAVIKANSNTLPELIPVNCFWGRTSGEVKKHTVFDKKTGRTINVSAANIMNERILKKFVPTPKGYIIDPCLAEAMKTLLSRHSIRFYQFSKALPVKLEKYKMIRIEKEPDDIYNRYEDRQIVEICRASWYKVPENSLYVPVKETNDIPAVLLLECSQLYGILTSEMMKNFAQPGKILPISRAIVLPSAISQKIFQ